MFTWKSGFQVSKGEISSLWQTRNPSRTMGNGENLLLGESTMSQIAEFHAAIMQNLPELDSEAMQEWIGPRRSSLRGILAQALANGAAPGKHPSPVAITNRLTVPPGFTLAMGLKRGRYDRISDNLTEKYFPITAEQIGEWEWELFKSEGHYSSIEQSIRQIQKNGFEPAQIGHLLAFGAAFPKEERKYPIIAPGSVMKDSKDGTRYAPYLWSDHVEREIRLARFDWDRSKPNKERLLGVRPVS